MLATEPLIYHASADAEQSFRRMARALAVYWREGLDGFGGSNWRLELGVRVQGKGDPQALDDYVLSAEKALQNLHGVSVKAWELVLDVIEHGWPAAKGDEYGHYNRWHTSSGRGIADLLGLGPKQSWPLVNAAVEALYQWLEMDGVLSAECLGVLR